MKLNELGRARGAENQPSTEQKELDHVEAAVVARIEELRRKGLENYEINRRIYNERLARAADAANEVDIAAGKTQGNLRTEVQKASSRIVAARDKLHSNFVWRNKFRQFNKIERPAKDFNGWLGVFALLAIIIICEAIFNAYLFAKGNELGLLGGAIAALIVSLVNVGGSFLIGYLTRYANHCSLILRIFGAAWVPVWLALIAAGNFLVAHFRDGLEAGMAWQEASHTAMNGLVVDPFGLTSVESWLLVGIGMLISAISFRKGWHTDDQYPGYGRVDRALAHARDRYEQELSDALGMLETLRDDGIDSLQNAKEQVRRGISEAIDALFGQSNLAAQLKAFIEQCDVKTAYLLAVYRDANAAARSTAAPKSFDKSYKFSVFKPEAVELGRRKSAEAQAAKVSATVDSAIKSIFAEFEAARTQFEVTTTVQRNEDQLEEVL